MDRGGRGPPMLAERAGRQEPPSPLSRERTRDRVVARGGGVRRRGARSGVRCPRDPVVSQIVPSIGIARGA
jgi:hypothetical protein